jgi:hypothetical protein
LDKKLKPEIMKAKCTLPAGWIRIIMISVISAISFGAAAQKGQTVSYTKTHDDPYDFKNLFIHLYPLHMDMGTPFSMNFGVGADYKMNKLLAFNANIVKSYFSLAEKTATSKSFQYIEAGAVFSFIDKERQGKTSVILHSSSGGSYSYTESIKLKGVRVRKELGVRGGLFYYGHPVTYKDLKDIPGITEASVYSNTEGVYAGISTTKTVNVTVEAEGYGTKTRKGRNYLYFDLMLAPLTSSSHNQDYKDLTPPDMEKFVVSKAMGWRLGLMYLVVYPRYSATIGMELGSRPGVSGGYFQMKVGFPIGMNVMNQSKKK